MLITFLASFSLKNYSEIVDTVYGHGGNEHAEATDDSNADDSNGEAEESPPAAAEVVEPSGATATTMGGPLGGVTAAKRLREEVYAEAYRFFVAKKLLDDTLLDHRKQRDTKTGLEKYKFIMDKQLPLIETIEGFSNQYPHLPREIEESLSHEKDELEREGSEELFNIVKKMASEIAELEKKIDESAAPKPPCENGVTTAKNEDTRSAKKEEAEAAAKSAKSEREARRMARTLYGRVWSDFSKFFNDYDSADPKEVKEEMDEFLREEVSNFLDEEFSELDSRALLNLDLGEVLSETKIGSELKNLDRTIRQLKRKGRLLKSKSAETPDEQAAKERELTSLAIQLYAANKMKSKIAFGVEKRFKAVYDHLVAAQTQSDEIKAREERMIAMATMFKESDPMTQMLLLEMFGDPLAGGASSAAPQGFSLDIGSSPGGGLRVGLGAQGAESGFALDFSQQPKDPFSGMFPNYPSYNYGGFGGFDPSFDPRRFGGSYWGN